MELFIVHNKPIVTLSNYSSDNDGYKQLVTLYWCIEYSWRGILSLKLLTPHVLATDDMFAT